MILFAIFFLSFTLLCRLGRSSLLLVDTRLTWPIVAIAILCFLFPFSADLQVPLYDGEIVRFVENLQALLLLMCAIFSFFYIRPLYLLDVKKKFWLWVVLWLL